MKKERNREKKSNVETSITLLDPPISLKSLKSVESHLNYDEPKQARVPMIVKYGMNSKQTTTTSGHSQPQTPLQSASSPHSPDSPQSVGTIPSSASIMAHSISGVGVSVGGGSQASGGRRRRSPEDQNNNNDSDTRSNSSGSRSGTRS